MKKIRRYIYKLAYNPSDNGPRELRIVANDMQFTNDMLA